MFNLVEPVIIIFQILRFHISKHNSILKDKFVYYLLMLYEICIIMKQIKV